MTDVLLVHAGIADARMWAPQRQALEDVTAPTLVIAGDEDVPDMRAIAAHVAERVPGARLEVVAGAAHLPSLERPAEVNRLLLELLG